MTIKYDLTVGKLKELIASLPDETPIVLPGNGADYTPECAFTETMIMEKFRGFWTRNYHCPSEHKKLVGVVISEQK